MFSEMNVIVETLADDALNCAWEPTFDKADADGSVVRGGRLSS